MLNRCHFSLFLSDSDAFDFEYGTLILRMDPGLDVSHLVTEVGQYQNLFGCFVLINRKSCIRKTTITLTEYFSSQLQSNRLNRSMKQNNRK